MTAIRYIFAGICFLLVVVPVLYLGLTLLQLAAFVAMGRSGSRKVTEWWDRP